MHHLHGKVINYNQLNLFHGRDEFVDKKIKHLVDEKISNNDDILFTPNHHTELGWFTTYQIVIFGILSDYVKPVVVLENFKPYFDVRIPEGTQPGEFKRRMSSYQCDVKLSIKKRINGYEENGKTYATLYFNNLNTRKKTLKIIRDNGYITSRDDRNHIERVINRDYGFEWCTWNTISNYKYTRNSELTRVKDCFIVDINNITEYKGEKSIESRTTKL